MNKPLFLKAALALAAAFCALSCGQQAQTDTPIYLDESQPIEARVQDALSRMTLEEKVAILHAQSKFSSAGVPRLGIPELWCTDGPHGIRPEVLWDEWDQAGQTNDSCTAFPALTCLASTFNTEMALLYGKSIGEEARYREKDVLLGPGVNIARTPLCGRNFEYMGEDPFLAGKMAASYTKGVQSNGVAVCVKHYAVNNQDAWRHNNNAVVDDRALYEIYLPAFKAAVQEGGAWSIMGAYSFYKNQHCAHNEILINKILKGEWGFDGAVISDWGGCHDTDEAANFGLDLEYGTWTDGLASKGSKSYDSYYLADPYLAKLRSGEASIDVLNEKAGRVLRLIFRTAMNTKKPFGSLNSPEHLAAARQIAGEGMVLLKNDGAVLPVEEGKVKTIAVIGENAIKKMTVGGGSSSLKVKHEYSPLDGILEAAEGKYEVVYERGYVGDTETSYNRVDTGQDLSENRSEQQLIDDAVAVASKADVVLFIGGLNKSLHQDCEGTDRLEYTLPYAQNKLIEALAAANSNLAVILVSGTPVEMPWIEKVPSVLEAWYCGSEAGHALADVVFGKVNPSGKLPFTFPVRLEDSPAFAIEGAAPGKYETVYKESVLVGYRWADTKGIKPLFAFGHGLSYTEFEYGDVTLSSKNMKANGTIKATVTVKNVGQREGKEAVQLYIGDPECTFLRPVKELKAFQKITLAPGESKKVTFEINAEMLKFFNDQTHEWTLEPGEFKVYIGASSANYCTPVSFVVK